MDLLPRTQPAQSADLAPDAVTHSQTDSAASRRTYRPHPTMIWVMESVGNRTRLVARWTMQD